MGIKNKMGINTKILIVCAGILICAYIAWFTIDKIRDKSLQNVPILHQLKKEMASLDPRIKNLELYKGDKSYTINKSKIYLCLFDENGEYYPMNTIKHVFLHEYAHVLNKKNIGHTPAFYEILEKLEKQAEKLGLYDSSKPAPPDYCTYNDK